MWSKTSPSSSTDGRSIDETRASRSRGLIESERVGEMNSHATVGGIWDVVKSEVVVELISDDIIGLAPSTGVAHGSQSQRNQGRQCETHLVVGVVGKSTGKRGYILQLTER